MLNTIKFKVAWNSLIVSWITRDIAVNFRSCPETPDPHYQCNILWVSLVKSTSLLFVLFEVYITRLQVFQLISDHRSEFRMHSAL